MHTADLVAPRERALGALTVALGTLVWLALIVGSKGAILGILAAGFLLYLFAQSALISYVRGNAVELSPSQFPDLHRQFEACCERLQIGDRPTAFVLNGNGGFNAFATRFLGQEYVVLYSDVVDAMEHHPDGVSFYLGHELGHIKRKHLQWHLLRWPVLWLPLLGGAYARACESTCDRHGLACSSSSTSAAQALVALASGGGRWARVDLPSMQRQAAASDGFWMSFHELIGGYPWVSKRVARVMDINGPVPGRNPFSYLFALFVPFGGRIGSGAGAMTTVAVIGILAAVALPAYQDYTMRAQWSVRHAESEPVRSGVAEFLAANGRPPQSLAEARLPDRLSDGSAMALEPRGMVLTIRSQSGELVYTPMVRGKDEIVWRCKGGETTPQKHLPMPCRER